MNYLLVMPRFIEKADETYIFPLGIAYVSASLKGVTDNVYTLNLNNSMEDIAQQVKDAVLSKDIGVLATGGLSPHFKQIRTIINTAKSVKRDIVTIAGGGMVTATPEVIMRGIPQLDIGMIGEGELGIIDIYNALECGGRKGEKDLKNIEGIIYRDEQGNIYKTSDRNDIEDLDALPFPDYEGFGFNAGNGVNICTSRSCPFNCTFCFHTCGKKYRARSLDNIFKEIDWLVEKYHIKSLGILDELFSIDTEKMLEFCRRIKPYKLDWNCQMRVDRMSLEMLAEMKASGCSALSFGIENADNAILKSMEKHITIEQTENALALAREAKINPFGNLLLGDKEDTIESFEKCRKWYLAHPELQLGFLKIMVLPGSKLYKYAVDNGYIKDELKYLEEEKYTINVTKMSDEEYRSCVQEIDRLVIQRQYPAKDIEIKSIDKMNRKVVVSCKCPLCDKRMEIGESSFAGGTNYTCPDCGQYFNVNLYQIFKESINNHLEKVLTNTGKHIVIWGMGNEGLRIAHMCSVVKHPKFLLVDKDCNKQGEVVNGKEIVSIDNLEGLLIDSVLVGTNAIIANQGIKKSINQLNFKVDRVENINQYLFDIISNS